MMDYLKKVLPAAAALALLPCSLLGVYIHTRLTHENIDGYWVRRTEKSTSIHIGRAGALVDIDNDGKLDYRLYRFGGRTIGCITVKVKPTAEEQELADSILSKLD